MKLLGILEKLRNFQGGGGGMIITPWNENSRAGGGCLRQKCPPWERGMDIFWNYTSADSLNVVYRQVHKRKAKESYVLHNLSTLLQGSQSLEKSMSFTLGP